MARPGPRTTYRFTPEFKAQAGRPAVHAPEGWRILRMPDRRLWLAVAAIAVTYALLRWHPSA